MIVGEQQATTTPSDAVSATVHIAYHVISELLKHPDALGTKSAGRIANGVLSRLREAWARHPEFLRATDDLRAVDLIGKRGKAIEGDRIHEIQVMLAVLSGVCEAFIVGFGQLDQGKMGF